jgi:NAD(P)H-hydrate epimerase
LDKSDIPYISREQMIRVDQLMIDDLGIQLIQMMENAGRHLAELARSKFLGGEVRGKKIVILAGAGGNGGGAMVSGRNLHNWGATVNLFLTKPVDQLVGTIKQQAEINQQLGLIMISEGMPVSTDTIDLIIDGIIGYSLEGAPRGRAAELIKWANVQKNPILALDVPTGLDATTGEVFSPAIHASATLTLALPKLGLKTAAKPVMGDLYLADIGVPPELYSDPSLGLQVGPIFHKNAIISL